MTVSPIAERIALRLDMTIAFEALILNRLVQLSASRREEWLRGLLVRGFQSECLALRQLTWEARAPADEPLRAPLAIEQLPVTTIHDQATQPHSAENVVSFSALKKVVG